MQEKFKPDRHFFRFLKSEYARRKYGYTTSQILDSVQEKMLCAAYGVTAWLFTKDGAKWVFSLLNIEEIDPHPAFTYYYEIEKERKKLDRKGSFRIFRKSTPKKAGIPLIGIEVAKRVVYTEGWKVPEENVFEFVFEYYRTWLRMTQGRVWATENFTAIRYVDNRVGIAYRFETREGHVYWFDSSQIISEPQTALDCECCEYEFPCCDNYTGMGRLCNRCYAEHFADPEVLTLCNRYECYLYDCHNYLNNDKLLEVTEGVKSLPIQWSANA